ncbi:MAG: hypothetical protein IKK28_01195 [Mogibacterium sp.]|nr:hypothetical protein [Mogibacterium sp.]MBR4089482.1 hypothetical protein [Mogibacterium sp.]
MNNTKFTMNALLVIVTVFLCNRAAIYCGIYDMGQHAFIITDYLAIHVIPVRSSFAFGIPAEVIGLAERYACT